MTPRHLTLLVVAMTLVLTACGSTPQKPELTDPRETIAAAATEAAAAQGVHIDASVDGSITLDLLGLGTGGGPVDLTGSTLKADLALRSGDARIIFAVGSALRGELRSVAGVAYVKTTLTGAQYQVQAGAPTIPPNAIPAALNTLLDVLEQPDLELVKAADVDCAGGPCYRVTLALTLAQLGALGVDLPIALPSDLESATVDLTVDVTRDTNDLSGLEAVLTQGDGQALTLVATFTKWDEAVAVEAPPADQVAPAGG